MTGQGRLLPMLLLALVAGCTPTSGDSHGARDDEGGATAAQPAVAPQNVAVAVPPADASRPGPSVRVEPNPEGEFAQTAADRAHPLDLPASNDAAPGDPFPDEVTSFMVDRDGCDHFRGEEPTTSDRRAYLQESIAELCTGTDARLAVLKQRYAKDQAVMAALSQYENNIEGNP